MKFSHITYYNMMQQNHNNNDKVINDPSRKKVNRLVWIIGGSNYCQETYKQKRKTKINQQTIIKNNRKIKKKGKVKTMGNITPNMKHYLRNRQMGDTDPSSTVMEIIF